MQYMQLRALRYTCARAFLLSDILEKLPKLSATSLQMDITTTRVIQKPIPLTSYNVITLYCESDILLSAQTARCSASKECSYLITPIILFD